MQTNSFDLLRRSQVYLKQAALKKGSSIEYVSENRIFTDADDYSMENLRENEVFRAIKSLHLQSEEPSGVTALPPQLLSRVARVEAERFFF